VALSEDYRWSSGDYRWAYVDYLTITAGRPAIRRTAIIAGLMAIIDRCTVIYRWAYDIIDRRLVIITGRMRITARHPAIIAASIRIICRPSKLSHPIVFAGCLYAVLGISLGHCCVLGRDTVS
jgi:hypothetical protein